jgi:RES domain-containing protein
VRRAYRITKHHHAQRAFDGEGAKLAGGRWNSPGLRAVYLSSTLSLAAIELFVHLGEDAAALQFVYFEVRIPAAVPVTRVARPPQGWRAEPPSAVSMHVGDRWLRAQRYALLEVPSALIPTETNLILNPVHEAASKLRISAPRAFRFDPRFWK